MKKLLPLVILLAVLAGLLIFFMTRPSPKTAAEIGRVNGAVEKLLVDKILFEPRMIKTKTVSSIKTFFETYEKVKFTVVCPLRFKDADLKTIFSEFVSQNPKLSVEYTQLSIGKEKGLVVVIKYDKQIITELIFNRTNAPKIAIIIDDWGYSKRNFGYLSKIKVPVAVAIIPGLQFSMDVAAYAETQGKEIFLHLPMQPKKKLGLVDGTIMANMTKAEIKALTEKNLALVSNARGVNNHEGSLISENAKIMEVIFSVLKEKNMFYIDSLTTGASTAGKVATKLGLKMNKRNIFIDNEKRAPYIERQLKLLKKVSKQKGYALAIGHDDPVTMKVLVEKIPELEAEGYEFVYPAELVY
ncbi:MAG: divergent polysaccharide deacetylase family protein [bacterium]